MSVRVAVGLGSNLGDRARHIAEAVRALAAAGALVRVSSMYETAPVGGPKQGKYLNAVAVFDTDLPAHELLDLCLDIEREHGRERRERWGPRTLDIDILLYGDETIEDSDLTVPHPRMTERRFVLEPLVEAWPDATLPDGTPLRGYLAAVGEQKVRRLEALIADRRTSLILFLVVAVAGVIIWWLGDWILG